MSEPRKDERDLVVAGIRESLPEFFQRNGVTVSERVMDNLAQWVTHGVPADLARVSCPNRPDPCACGGWCSPWRRVESVWRDPGE